MEVTTMDITMDLICFSCGCDPQSKECEINNTLLTEYKSQRYNCKLLRYMHNREIAHRS